MSWIREVSKTDQSFQNLQPQLPSSHSSQDVWTEWHCVVLTLVTETPKFTTKTPPLTSAQAKQGAALCPSDTALT